MKVGVWKDHADGSQEGVSAVPESCRIRYSNCQAMPGSLECRKSHAIGPRHPWKREIEMVL